MKVRNYTFSDGRIARASQDIQARRTVRWNVEQYTAHAKQQAPTTKLLSRLGSRLGDCARRHGDEEREQIATTDGESELRAMCACEHGSIVLTLHTYT